MDLCDWFCPGYTGASVTTKVLQPPNVASTVFLHLQLGCPVGLLRQCSVSLPTSATETAAQHCQLLASAVASSSCASAGFAVQSNACVGSNHAFTVSNSTCANPLAVGISTFSGTFDQTSTGTLSDGEMDVIAEGLLAPAVPALPAVWRAIAAALLGLIAITALARRHQRRRPVR